MLSKHTYTPWIHTLTFPRHSLSHLLVARDTFYLFCPCFYSLIAFIISLTLCYFLPLFLFSHTHILFLTLTFLFILSISLSLIIQTSHHHLLSLPLVLSLSFLLSLHSRASHSLFRPINPPEIPLFLFPFPCSQWLRFNFLDILPLFTSLQI